MGGGAEHWIKTASPKDIAIKPRSDWARFRLGASLAGIYANIVVDWVSPVLMVPLLPVVWLLQVVQTVISNVTLLFIPALILALLVDGYLWTLRQFLFYTSRSWQTVPVLRLPLAIICIPSVVIGYELGLFTGYKTDGAKSYKHAVLAMCDSWPLSDLAWDRATRMVSLLKDADAAAPAPQPCE